MNCYSICQNIDAFCEGVLSAINNDKVDYIAIWQIKGILENIQYIARQAKFIYYEKIKEEDKEEK